MNSIVFTHGDSDGICSGAIAKSAFPGSTVFFTNPVNLLSDLNGISEHYDNIVICDIAIDEKTSIQIKQKLSELAQISDVSYIDHHPVPEGGFNKSWFHHDTCSSAELTYRIFEKRLNRDIRRVAIYGAIGEFSETAAIKKWERLWDVRTLYFYAGTLIQGITYAGRDYDYKRKIVDSLSEDIPPPEIEGLLEAAAKASQNEEQIISLVREKVVKLKNLSYVIDINGYMSKAAIYAGSFGRTLVGVSCEYRPHKQVYDISLRLKNGGVDLNTILRRLAPYHGGTGGGHPFAGGARIPRDELKAFLYDLDDALGR